MGKTTFSDFDRTDIEGKKAAIYVRVSQNEFQRKSNQKPASGELDKSELEARQSVKTQRSDAIKICKENDWKYQIYDKDCETSGTLIADSKTGRKDLARLIDDIKNKRIHTVITRDVKRFARNNRHLKDLIFDVLIPNGVPLIGTSQPLDITTPEGRVFVSLLGEFAELEVYNTRAVSMHNREAKAKEGTLLLNPYTFGYDNNQGNGPLLVVESEKKTVKRIFEMYTKKHMSYMAIANILNEEGVPTKWKGHVTAKKDFTKALWVESQIAKTLRNVRYIGKISYKKKIYDSPFPPIISDKLWKETEAEIARRKTKGGYGSGFVRKSRHLLSGILKCGYCLENYEENVAKGWKTTPSMTINYAGKNQKHVYYACQTRTHINKKYCQGTRIPAPMIEEFIEKFIGGFAAAQFDELITQDAETIERLKNEINIRKDEFHEVSKRRGKLAKKFATGVNEMDVEILVNSDRICKKEMARLQDEIYDRENKLSAIVNDDACEAFDELKEWKKLDLQEKRRALKKVIPRIVLYKDRMEFTVVHPDSVPVKVPYVPPNKNCKTRELPKLTDEWPFFIDEDGVWFKYGGGVSREDIDLEVVYLDEAVIRKANSNNNDNKDEEIIDL